MALPSEDPRGDDPTLRARYLVFVKIRNLLYHLLIDDLITEAEKKIAIKNFVNPATGRRSWVDVRKMTTEEVLDQIYEDLKDWIEHNSR